MGKDRVKYVEMKDLWMLTWGCCLVPRKMFPLDFVHFQFSLSL